MCVNQKQIWPSLPPSVENSHPLSEDGDLLGRRNKTKVGIQVETSETLKGHLWGTTALLPCLMILGSAIYGAPYMLLVEGWLRFSGQIALKWPLKRSIYIYKDQGFF